MSDIKTYIFTSAQASYHINKDGDKLPYGGGKVGKAPANKKFLRGLETLRDELDAELNIIPIAGKNTLENILHSDFNGRDDIFDGTFKRLNGNLQLRDLLCPPQNVDPTTGKSDLVGKYGSSIIFAHAKQRFLPVPVTHADLPRYLFTTGAVTEPNYNTANSRGDNAERNHVHGAIVVEVIDDVFYNIRNVRALVNGKFADMGVSFNGGRKPGKMKVDTLVLGDLHWGDHDPNAIEANYEMIEHFQPKRIVLHDLFNGHSINHHEKENYLTKVREFNRGRLSLDNEFEELHDELEFLSKCAGPKTEIHVVSSNHDAFLPRYINGGTWLNRDLWNAEIGADLFRAGIALNLDEKEIDDASYLIQEGLKRHGDIPSNINFLRLDEHLRKYGFELGSHGHKGGHGSRGGSAKARRITGGGRSVTGHSHTMEIFGDTYIVGTSSKLDLPYTAGGGSAWISANLVLYENGTCQMLPSINGKWKAKR